MKEPELSDTRDPEYAERLRRLNRASWKQRLDVQRPYRWNLQRQQLGRTLDVGCGIGRNLVSLPTGSVGVDHNEDAIAECRSLGLTAYTSAEWENSPERVDGAFDGMLFAHLLEHVEEQAWQPLLHDYLPYLRPGGRAFFVCPQERGYASDSTHVRFTTGEDLMKLASQVGLRPEPWFSFPLPRWAGRRFIYNEFCLLAVKPG